jgi:hypothetical protein
MNCQKGYKKNCHVCGNKAIVEAVYRNELMDDIL